jgi:hypothetical protein
MLERDPADMMVDALIFFINNTANGTHTPYSPTPFYPTSSAVSVNCLLFVSLGANVIAALASVVALQWVAEYDAAVSRSGSSPEDRVKRRQFRYGGMKSWKMREIIAALPIFLYCSLVLFFVGLAQWMWSVHTTIGGVLIGSLILGTVFYFVTTLLAVVFPSSPFRAPIVRWAYVVVYVLLRILTRWMSLSNASAPGDQPQRGRILTTLVHLSKAAKKLLDVVTYRNLFVHFLSRFAKSSVQERDQEYIDTRKNALIGDSLIWLAQNISVSQDSHRRLLLLAQEASKMHKDQQHTKEFGEIPWGQIFHVLGAEYAQQATIGELTEEDEKDLQILLKCLRNPRMGRFIAPGEEGEYEDVTEQIDTTHATKSEGPNPTYTLLRNIDPSDKKLSIAEQVKLRVGCLNQIHRIPHPASISMATHAQLTSGYSKELCDYLIPPLAKELESSAHDDDQERVYDLVGLACFRHPFLRDFPLEIQVDHERTVTIRQPSPAIHRLHCFNWVWKNASNPHIHDIMKALMKAWRRNPDLKLLWRFEASNEEIDTALTLVNAHNRPILSKILHKHRKNLCLWENLVAFDILARGNLDPTQKGIIFKLLIKDLKAAKSPLYAEYLKPDIPRSLDHFQDPYIRFLAYAAFGTPTQDPDPEQPEIRYMTIPEPLRRPLSDYLMEIPLFGANRSTIDWSLVWLWKQLDYTATIQFIEQALLDYGIMVC